MPAKFRELLRHHTYSRLLAFSVRPTENATLSKAIIDNRCGAQLTIISTSGLHRLAKFGWTFGRVVFELCEWTDKQTDGQTNRHTHHNTSHSCRGEVTRKKLLLDDNWRIPIESAVLLTVAYLRASRLGSFKASEKN